VRTPALVAVSEPPSSFESLFGAARALRLRLGWLELGASVALEGPLEAAAGLGALRAVAAGAGRVVTSKPIRGEPVLRDLLREHFLGCAVVLVRGLEGHPRLSTTAAGYRLELANDRARALDAESALAELVRPRYRS